VSVENGPGSSNIIARLQSIMLTSVLRNEPLPGQAQPVRFPDLAWISDAPRVLVSEENVPGQLDVAGIDKPVDLVPESGIREEAARSGDRAYVRFQPAEHTDNQIRIAMEVRIAPSDPDIPPLGLGGIVATFAQRSDDQWEVIEPPAVFGI
jgi:hypothetical protein